MVSLTTFAHLSQHDYVREAEQIATAQNVSIALPDQALVFMQAVWSVLPAGDLVALGAQSAYIQAGAWRETVAMDWIWVDEIRQDAYSLDWATQKNTAQYTLPGLGGIYWHGASRKRSVLGRHHARGSLDELMHVGSFWADLDCEKRGYTLKQGMDVLLSMPIKPSVVVFSGGGLQAIHLFSEPWSVLNQEAAKEYKAHSLALYGPSFRQADIQLDESVHEAARMMRLPGFANRKPSRNGAMARIVYWHPEIRTTIQRIKQLAPLPVAPVRLLPPARPTPKTSDGTPLYRVGREFVAYLIEGEKPAERHPALLRIAMQACKAGIDRDALLIRLRPVARKWFYDQPGRADGELDNLINWAYQNALTDTETGQKGMLLGSYLVKVADNCFALAANDEVEAANDQTVTIIRDELASAIPDRKARPTLSLDTLREEMARLLAEYITDIPGAPKRRFGSYFLLRTSPGAGKTHSVWHEINKFAVKWLNSSMGHGGAAFLSLFKFEEYGWREYVESFGIDPQYVFYLVARNGDPKSAGYCSYHDQAEAVGRKNWVIKQTLCARCPARMECEQSWYLSQFKTAKFSPILLARHQHGMIDEIIEMRKLIVFDESPLDVTSQAIILTQDELIYHGGLTIVEDQYQVESDLLRDMVDALRAVVTGNDKPQKGQHEHLSEKHVKLGGRWLFERIEALIGMEKLKRIMEIPEHIVRDAARATLRDMTPESVAALPINYLQDTWYILQYEYHTYYARGAKRWNSRVIPSGSQLRVYRMEPFNYSQNVKVVITDATGQPELYAKAFSYTKTIQGTQRALPRQAFVFDEQLDPLARITQFVGTDNTRKTIRRKRKVRDSALTITDADGNTHDAPEREIDSLTYDQTKEMIQQLAAKHNGSLLVVTYKHEAQQLRKWVTETKTLDPEYVRWFGGLRGKNDFQALEASLVVGTPRIPPIDTLCLAQVWHWQDELPVDTELATRIELYPADETANLDGQSKGYQYIGYADDRVNDLYIHQIRAEIRQCYERIRPNASKEPRYIYLGTAFPASDHVSEFQSWITWQTDRATEAEFEQAQANRTYLAKAKCVQTVMSKQGVSQNAARASFERVFERWQTRVEDTAYRFYDANLQSDVITFGEKPGEDVSKSKAEKVKAWLDADPARRLMSNRSIVKALADEGITVTEPTVRRAR